MVFNQAKDEMNAKNKIRDKFLVLNTQKIKSNIS